MTATTSDVDDEINNATGYANGDTFTDADDVRAYFTVSNMRDMFGFGRPFDGEPTQETLDEWAAWVIDNRSHMVKRPTVCLSDVKTEIVDAMTRADDKGRNWWAVRVGTDGTVYTSEEVSKCYSESEYYGRAPHPVTVWSLQSSYSTSPSDGCREWDDCEADEAEFFAVESPTGTEYKRDWCYPADRDELPQFTVPKKLGGWVDLDLSDLMRDVQTKLEACDWLEVTE